MFPTKNKIIQQKSKASAWLTQGCLMLCIALVFTLSACKNYLDLPPRDKMAQGDLFKDEQGFIDALNGVYMGMDKPASGGLFGLYTNHLTMGMLSVMANNYPFALNSTLATAFYAKTANYNYMDATVRKEIDAIWSGMYSNISNVNNLLKEIDGKRDVFSRDNFSKIKGEALALRALFHFDLVRLYGQSPVTGANEKAIPYITKFGAESTPFVTLNVALDSCISDLNKANSLLAQTDTTAIKQVSYDLFTSFTQNHMNYWATKALLARLYLYKGDFPKAMEYAKAIIASNKFPLITRNTASDDPNFPKDRLFSQELVFSLFSTAITNTNNNLFVYAGTPANTLWISTASKSTLYPGNDYRLSWFDATSSASVTVPSKYYQNTGLPYQLQNIVPLLRVSEMYYIVAECANNNGDLTTGLSYLNKVRTSRNLSALTSATITDAGLLSNEIKKEYKKEFIQEGQTFFYYKRLNMNLATETGTTVIVPSNVYVFPIPDKENEYNH